MKEILIISTVSSKTLEYQTIIKELEDQYTRIKVINTESMHINHCLGCTSCWIKTPGKCVLKDDYESIFKQFLKADKIIFISDSNYGFISSKTKHLIDRILPTVCAFTEFENGATRHVSRYKKQWQISLLYLSKDKIVFLDQWFKRVALNIRSKSLGAYHFEERRELYYEISHH